MPALLSLPPECRDLIYRHLFAGAVIEDYGMSPRPILTKNYHLPITLTSKQIRSESLPVLNSSTLLHFRIGQAQLPPIPTRVLCQIETVRMPAHRLRRFDPDSFGSLRTLVLDVSIDLDLWRLFQRKTKAGRNGLADVSDLIDLSITLQVFEHSWDVKKLLDDEERKFKMLCWISAWIREESLPQRPVLVDLDKGLMINELVH